MANIPSHMRLHSDLVGMRGAPRTSNVTLIVMGAAIGFAIAAVVLLSGLLR